VAGIIDRSQALVDKHFSCAGRTREELIQLLPNLVLDREGREIKPAGSVLPKRIVQQIRELSYEYMALSDDVDRLAQAHYGPMIASGESSGADG
jgi:hypothetical protein